METLKLRKITSVWIIIVLTLFVVAIVLGILMRLNQGEIIQQSPITFYGNMTTHGLTMIGIWFVAGMAAVNYLLERYVKTSYAANLFALALTVIGVLMLWCSTFIGEFHAGWTFLYPLPFKIMWAEWATPLFLSSLGVLGLGWLVWSISLMAQILKKSKSRNSAFYINNHDNTYRRYCLFDRGGYSLDIIFHRVLFQWKLCERCLIDEKSYLFLWAYHC